MSNFKISKNHGCVAKGGLRQCLSDEQTLWHGRAFDDGPNIMMTKVPAHVSGMSQCWESDLRTPLRT